MRNPLLLAAALTALAALPPAARADAATETRLRDALRAATSQARALEEERATWQAKEAKLQAELEALRKDLAATRGRPRGCGEAERRLEEARQKLAQQAEESGKVSASLAQCQSTGQDARKAAQVSEDERARLSAEATALRDRVAAAEVRNAQLYRTGKDILDWLSRLGVGAAVAAREPFLEVKRVELENTAQDFEDKLLEHRGPP
jgi:chromosome segregation ATPase